MLTLRGFWYIAAQAGEVGPEPIRRSVEGETLVLFRDASGAVRALRDRCAHRGMALSRGTVADGCLRCPYHGWTYGPAGALRTVPSLAADAPVPRVAVPSYPVVEQDGHVWVWVGDSAPDVPPFRFPYVGEAGWSHFFMHTRFEADAEDCLENFLDVPHTVFVHPGLFREENPAPSRVRVRRTEASVVAEFLDEPELRGIGPRLMFPKGTRMRHTDRFLLPSISRVDYAFGDAHRFVITSQCTQRGPFETDVTTCISWRLPVPRWIAAPFLKRYCRRVIEQDVEIMKVQGDQARAFGRAWTHSEADLLGPHIASLRRAAAEGRRPTDEVLHELLLRI